MRECDRHRAARDRVTRRMVRIGEQIVRQAHQAGGSARTAVSQHASHVQLDGELRVSPAKFNRAAHGGRR